LVSDTFSRFGLRTRFERVSDTSDSTATCLPSGETEDQLRRLEGDVELRSVSDTVEHDPVGVR
jgi:hypothetical protein